MTSVISTPRSAPCSCCNTAVGVNNTVDGRMVIIGNGSSKEGRDRGPSYKTSKHCGNFMIPSRHQPLSADCITSVPGF